MFGLEEKLKKLSAEEIESMISKTLSDATNFQIEVKIQSIDYGGEPLGSPSMTMSFSTPSTGLGSKYLESPD